MFGNETLKVFVLKQQSLYVSHSLFIMNAAFKHVCMKQIQPEKLHNKSISESIYSQVVMLYLILLATKITVICHSHAVVCTASDLLHTP